MEPTPLLTVIADELRSLCEGRGLTDAKLRSSPSVRRLFGGILGVGPDDLDVRQVEDLLTRMSNELRDVDAEPRRYKALTAGLGIGTSDDNDANLTQRLEQVQYREGLKTIKTPYNWLAYCLIRLAQALWETYQEAEGESDLGPADGWVGASEWLDEVDPPTSSIIDRHVTVLIHLRRVRQITHILRCGAESSESTQLTLVRQHVGVHVDRQLVPLANCETIPGTFTPELAQQEPQPVWMITTHGAVNGNEYVFAFAEQFAESRVTPVCVALWSARTLLVPRTTFELRFDAFDPPNPGIIAGMVLRDDNDQAASSLEHLSPSCKRIVTKAGPDQMGAFAGATWDWLDRFLRRYSHLMEPSSG